MTTKNSISINEPCHQGWGNMSVSDKGKFCGSCKKHVYDFSNSTLADIKQAYVENNGDLCGHVPVRILQEQFEQSETYKRHFSYLKTFCLAAIFCFGANLFTIDSAKATTLQTIKKSFFSIVSDSNKDSISVSGIVKDKDLHTAIPYATIVVYHYHTIIYQTKANANGEYEVKIAKKNKFVQVDITASYMNYAEHRMRNISIVGNKQIIVDIDIEHGSEMVDGKMEMSPKIDPKEK